MSSVSPERCEITDRKPALCAISTASSVSVSVPIWLSLTRIALADVFLDTAREPLDVGHEQVVADELDALAERAA